MVILLTILCILAIVCAIICTCNDYDLSIIISVVGAILIGILDIIIIISASGYMIDGVVANSKIEMYEKENTKIETQIGDLVKKYMEFESDTYKEFKNESSITLVNMYPELKSDELVQKQINIYLENNNKIKELKEQNIDFKIGKWLFYFGN